MGKFFLAMTLAGCVLPARAETFLWSEALNDSARWQSFNSSGKVTFRQDSGEQAIRFEADFSHAKNDWAYPTF